ncbi:MAG: GspH/FimT family pseudopilin [Burkholderiaceae bacterium]|nr:GspH/FimT family pseudopilin [Burkholderiaceae bacterium]
MSQPYTPTLQRPDAATPARGVTLIELMVGLAVLVVVMSVAAPAMSEFSANNQVVAAKSGFAAAVGLARTEAARRGRPVIVQALGSGDDAFASGWEVVVDDNADGSAADSEPRVRRYAAPAPAVRISGNASLVFRASGALQGTSAEDYSVCRRSGSSQGYAITVNPSGAADVAATAECGS